MTPIMKLIVMIIIDILMFGLGFATAVLHRMHKYEKAHCGYLNIDRSTEGEPLMFAEFNKPIEYIQRKMYIVLQVKNENYLKEKEHEIK